MNKFLQKFSIVAIGLVLLLLAIGLVLNSKVYGENFLSKLRRMAILTAEKIQGYDLSLKEAMWYKKLATGEVQCKLCPFECVIPEGKRGKCGVRANIDGTLRALTYGKPLVVKVEPVEQQPIFHYLPQARTLVVGTAGCNLECKFCQNWTIAQTLPENEEHYNLSPEELIETAKERKCQIITFAATEPIVFYEYIYETAKLADKQDIKIAVKTAGYVNPEPLRELCKYVDVVNIDIKGFSEEYYREYIGGRLQPVLEAAKIIKEEGVWEEVAYLVVPAGNDNPEEIRTTTDWIMENLGADTPMHFTRFLPNYKLANRPPTPFSTLEKAVNIAKESGLKYPYVVIVPGNPYEDTYCPVCQKKIIDRDGFDVIENHIIDGKCEYCGAEIEGVFRKDSSQ